jgi:hypothetical protein
MAHALKIKDSELLKKARERFKLANETDTQQAQRERDDIAFEAGEQWPADIKQARQGQQPSNGLPAVPARPTLVINKIKEPVRQVLNQEREADIGVTLVPADDFGDLGILPDDTEIELREGLIRQIQRDSKASDARTWAFKRAAIAGRGYYLVNTRYLPGKTFDQEVYIERIFNQSGVLLDPSHEQPDGSDAEWEFIGKWVPWDKYKSHNAHILNENGKSEKNPYSDYSESDFMALTEEYPDWYKAEGDERAVREVSYWYAEYETRTLCQMDDGTEVWKDELPEGVQPASERQVVDKRIKYCRIGGGVQILEQTDVLSPDMPIIKVVGDELLPYDSERRVEGMVRPARDGQMGFNYSVSRFVENIGSSTLSSLMLDPDAIEGYEAWYAQMATRMFPYLPYRSRDDQGRELLPPTRPPKDVQSLELMQAIGMFDQTIKSTTAVPDPTLGNVDPSLKSGRAIREVVANAQMSTSNFLDNLARSVRYEGQVINNLLYPIYGQKPGRLVRIMTGEGEPQMMLIGEPEDQQRAAAMQQRAKKVAKLTKDAYFNVVVKVAKSFDSRRTEIASKLGELIAAAPEQMAIAGDILYKNMDIPEAKQLAERMRVMLAPPVQEFLAQKEQGRQVDPAAQAEIQALKQQIQEAEAAIQQLAEEAKGKRIESQTKLQIAQLEAERDVLIEREKLAADLEKARMDNATKQYVADVAAKTKGQIQAAEHAHDEMATATQLAHEAEQKQLDRDGQARMAAHDAAMADGAADRADEGAEADRLFQAGENERNRQSTQEAGA